MLQPIVPYKFPAVFSVPLAFIAIWFFSITDKSDDAQRCIDEFDAQDIRCQTGIGADGAVRPLKIYIKVLLDFETYYTD